MRNRELFLFTGINGTGKSTLVMKLANLYISKRREKVLLLVPDFAEHQGIKELKTYKYTGIRKQYFSKDNLQEINENFKNGLIIFDDVRFMLPSNIENFKPFYNLLIRRRQKNIDLYFTSHALTEVPPKLYTFLNYLILFRTSDNIDRYKKYILKFDYLKQKQNKINNITSEKPHYYEVLKLN